MLSKARFKWNNQHIESSPNLHPMLVVGKPIRWLSKTETSQQIERKMQVDSWSKQHNVSATHLCHLSCWQHFKHSELFSSKLWFFSTVQRVRDSQAWKPTGTVVCGRMHGSTFWEGGKRLLCEINDTSLTRHAVPALRLRRALMIR